MIDVPAGFVLSTVAREGERARAWLDGLPELVGGLVDRWCCAPTGPVTHGFVAVVVPVRRAEGTPAVLKVSWPHAGNVAEPVALATWAGRGAVALLERDDDSFAMLLERLPAEPAGSLADPLAAVTVAGRLARRLAIPAPPGLPSLAGVAAEWSQRVPEESAELGGPLPIRVVHAAVAALRELATDQPDTMVHGDLHPANILRGHREPWQAIDPKGFTGDPAYDAVSLLRYRWDLVAGDDDPAATVRRRLAAFAEAAEVDRDRARRWAQARAVVDALWSRAHGEPAAITAVCDHLATILVG